MTLARSREERALVVDAPLSILNELSMLAVIALCLATIILSSVHIGRHFGWFRSSFPMSFAASGPGSGTVVEPPEALPLHPKSRLVEANNPGADTLISDLTGGRSATAGVVPLTPPPPLGERVWVPILMYHYVRVSPDRSGMGLSVTPPDFAAQMHYLKDHGYNTITLRQLDLWLMGKQGLPPRPVALTFDDGYQDFYTTAAPVLRELGLTATCYIPTMLVGGPAYMSWPEIVELDSQAFEMAAHSQFHVNVARVPVRRAQVEIFGAKSDLENHLGHPVVDWAYPYGGFDNTAVQLVQQAGYWSGASTNGGAWHDAAQLPLLTRVRVNGGETLDQFARSLNP